jgi:hypothetical protein
MARFYKGIGVGTHLHAMDLRVTGISPRMPTAAYSVNTLMQHIARATTTSCCISLTRSYGIAVWYARHGKLVSAPGMPGHVYEIEIPDPAPLGTTVVVHDPVSEVSSSYPNPLAPSFYYHDGDSDFLLGVVNPSHMKRFLQKPVMHPPGTAATPRRPNLSIELETVVRALRDAEVLAEGDILPAWVLQRHDVV